MKRFDLKSLGWVMGFGLFSFLACKADEKVPCLIFSGNAESEYSIDLSKLNRITFGDNSMVISSSKDDAEKSVELLYSLYHHFEIGDAAPSGIEAIDVDSDYRISVDAKSKLLLLKSSSDVKFSVGVFNIDGFLLLSSELCDGEALTLETLSSGTYIAVATDGNAKLSIKFILN